MYTEDPWEGECEDSKEFLSRGGLPLSSQNLKASTKAGHPMAAVIHFLSHLPEVCCYSPVHLAQLSPRVLLGGEDVITPDGSRPFLSLPSFVFAVQTAFCYSCQWSFQKQESCFLWPLRARVQYIWCLEHQTNSCAHSAEIIPDKRRPRPCGEYERDGVGKLPVESKKRLFHQLCSLERNRKPEAVKNLLRALCPQLPLGWWSCQGRLPVLLSFSCIPDCISLILCKQALEQSPTFRNLGMAM